MSNWSFPCHHPVVKVSKSALLYPPPLHFVCQFCNRVAPILPPNKPVVELAENTAVKYVDAQEKTALRQIAAQQTLHIPTHADTEGADMKRADVFPSNWLKADDLKGKKKQLTVKEVTMEDIGGENKAVMWFEGQEKGMILNATNWGECEIGWDLDDSDDWAGKEVYLSAKPVQFKGKTVKGLRLEAIVPDEVIDQDIPL